MSGELEIVPASYLQDDSFLGQKVMVTFDAPTGPRTVAGSLVEVEVLRAGSSLVLEVVHQDGSLCKPWVWQANQPLIVLFIAGEMVCLPPDHEVVVEPAPAALNPRNPDA